MKTYLEYVSEMNALDEAFENLIGFDKDTAERKDRLKAEVYGLLQQSYAKIGGIKGSGFGSKDEMAKKIWFWKLYKQNGKPAAVIMYKDRDGRKMAALGTDGSDKAKAAARKMVKDEISLNRSYGEASGPALAMVKKLFNVGRNGGFEGSELEKYLVPAELVGDILKKPVKPVSKYEYVRTIGGDEERKVMLGRGYRRPSQK